MGAGRELYGLRKDGSEFPVEIGLNTIETEDGAMVLLAIVDISARRRLDERVRRVVEAAPNAIVTINGAGRIEMVNAQAERVFGYARCELLGQPVEMLLPGQLRDHRLRDRFLADPQAHQMGAGRDFYARRKDGSEFPAVMGLNPVETEDRAMAVWAIVDISDRKQKEDRIQAALREKDVLLGEIHHRVKNNLQIVYSLLDLQSARISDQKVLDMLRDSQNRIRSMALIHQTLYQSKDFAEVNFGRFLETLVPTLIASYGVDPDRITLTIDAEQVLLPIDAAIPCGLAVNELISNALQHAFRDGRGGEITVVLAQETGSQVMLVVSDNGTGVPDHIDMPTTGTLGLQLVTLLAEQLGGSVAMQRSNPTRFTLRFPINKPIWWRTMMPARVMVVEDERIVALHLQQKLVKLGYGVPGVAASGEQALEQIEASRPDLVLMDIHIDGGIDGIETVTRIPAGYHIPVIYLTAYSEEATLERARATRPYGYLTKPFSERELHATIQMALERCSSEKALRKTEAALRQAQKMEAIGKLAGGVAHDFNNLLGVIIGNLEFIADRTRVDADLHEMVQDALDAALRTANLTQTLLAYSRRQPLVPRVLSIEGLVSNLTELMRRTVGATIEIRTQIPAHLWRVRVDPHQFDTALLNLTVNARDAMPRGGMLTIEADDVVLDQNYADRHLEVAAGNYVLIAVTDTGTGMPREVTDKVLDPFFTTKPAGKGTGLGLSMVYGFVKQSHGHLEISSEAGHGTTIKLYFPAAGNWDEDLNQPFQPTGALDASGEGEA